MTPELALRIAKARHRYAGEPLDEKAVAEARRLDEFRQYLAGKLDIAVRLELMFQSQLFLGENGKAKVRLRIDENEFVLSHPHRKVLRTDLARNRR
jgi:hypothetical protein